ncbi:hypothetical protein DPMN_096073, partial [Dreissena polymorpha]
AGELDVLTAVMKWGENLLVKRIEKREPNLLSHTAHSVSKKGVKRRDFNDVELREIMAEILPLVRMDHVIPHNNEVLMSAIRRGVVSLPPSHMYSDDTGVGQTAAAWVPGRNNGMFMKPRLFTPYYDEAKSMLEEREMSSNADHNYPRVRTIQMSSIPDTLYMVDDPQYVQQFMAVNPVPLSNIDIVSGSIPVPSVDMLKMMIERVQDIQSTPQIQRAFSLPYTDRRSVCHQLQLRVVREFGWPDTTVDVIQNAHYYYNSDPHNCGRGYQDHSYPPLNQSRRRSNSQLELRLSRQHSPPKPVQRTSSPVMSLRKSYRPSTFESPSSSPSSDYEGSRSATLTSNHSTLSDTMPDIAMATGAVSQMQLDFTPLQLDIGDEQTGRHGTLYI